MARLTQIRINWRLKAVLPVVGILLAGLLAFAWLLFSYVTLQRHHLILLAAAGAVVICAVMLAVLAVLIQQPLVELRQKIAQLRHGNLDVTASFAVRNDELGDLGRDFNEMARSLRESIAERKRAEADLRQSEANLNRAQEVAHIGSWYLDISRDRLTWSDEVFRIFGIGKGAALTYEEFLATVHPDDREFVHKAWTAAMHGAPYDIEHRIILGDELKWVRERAKVEFDHKGNAVEGIGTVQDITERKGAEEEIRALNADLEQRVIARTAELETANRLKDELIVRERAASTELEQAREREGEIGFRIQQTLLLDQPPRDIPGLQVAALTVPSERIGGDFYIFIQHQTQSLDVIVGDVMGKGIPAALLGAATKSHFIKALGDLMALSRNRHIPEPREVVMLAHAGIVRHLIELESFVTLCYARLDVSQRGLCLVDCGHTGIVHLHGKTGLCEVLRGDNLPMGIREGEIYEQISIPFEPGDLLLLYSDGITDARNPEKELFGVERLKECIRSHAQLEPEAVLQAIRNAIFAFCQCNRLGDDLTGVAIRIQETQLPLAVAKAEMQSDLKQLRRAREFVRAFCHDIPDQPLDEGSICALELAVNEAASNISNRLLFVKSFLRFSCLFFPSFPDCFGVQFAKPRNHAEVVHAGSF